MKDSQVELIEEFVELLEPFYDFTVLLSGSKYVTCSLIIPAFKKLTDYLKAYKSPTNNLIINTIASDLHNSLTERGKSYFNKQELLAAAFLDPRFRSFLKINKKNRSIMSQL